MTFTRPSKPGKNTCAHAQTISVTSAGLERIVCETCAYVSVHFMSSLSGEIDRAQFARPADSERRHVAAQDGYWTSQAQQLAVLSPTG